MTDEQFDEVCRRALAFEPGPARASTWSNIRPARWNWLPTVPEILACGFACGLVLYVLAGQFSRNPGLAADSNPVIQKAIGGALPDLQASTLTVPDMAELSETSTSLFSAPRAFNWAGLR
jgi:phage tail protein X